MSGVLSSQFEFLNSDCEFNKQDAGIVSKSVKKPRLHKRAWSFLFFNKVRRLEGYAVAKADKDTWYRYSGTIGVFLAKV